MKIFYKLVSITFVSSLVTVSVMWLGEGLVADGTARYNKIELIKNSEKSYLKNTCRVFLHYAPADEP